MAKTFTAKWIGESERDEYNQVVQSTPHVDFLQSYEWGEIKRSTGWEPLRAILQGADGRAIGGVTFLCKRLPFVGRTFLYAPRGPAIDYSDAELVSYVLQLAHQLAQERRSIFVKVDPDVPKPDPSLERILREHGMVRGRYRPHWGGVQPVAVCRLSLAGELDEILAGFRQKTRYNIRLAERKGVVVRRGERSDLPLFHAIWQETAARQNFGVRGLDHLYPLWDHLLAKGYGILLMAYVEERPIAGVICVAFGPKAWYLYGGTSNLHRDKMPMYLLQWEAMRWAKEKGCTLYDFLGVTCHMDPRDPLYGLYRFKRGFNPDYVEFIGEYDLPVEPLTYKAWNRVEPVYMRTMRQVGRAKRTVGGALKAGRRVRA